MDKKPSTNLIPTQGGFLQDITLRTKLVFRLMSDSRVSLLLKAVPVAALAYLISPLDFIPAAVAPIVGTLDDAAIVWLGIYMFLEMCPPDVVREHVKNLISNNQVISDEMKKAQDDGDIVDGEATDIK